MNELIQPEDSLLVEIKSLIDGARQRAAAAVNSELTLLYWQVGTQIRKNVLDGERAEYGKQVVKALADQLTSAYGKGWGLRQLRYCIQMADAFPDQEIVNALRAQLSWPHSLHGQERRARRVAQLDKSNIRVAEYLTELSSREILQNRLHQSIEIARQKLIGQQK